MSSNVTVPQGAYTHIPRVSAVDGGGIGANRIVPEELRALAARIGVTLVSDQPEITVGNPKPKRRFGSARGRYIMAPDFDDPLPEFAEHQ